MDEQERFSGLTRIAHELDRAAADQNRPNAAALYDLFKTIEVLPGPIASDTCAERVQIYPGLRKIVTLDEEAQKVWANGRGELVTHFVYDVGFAELPFLPKRVMAFATYLEGETESTSSGKLRREIYKGDKPSQHIMASTLYEDGSATLEGGCLFHLNPYQGHLTDGENVRRYGNTRKFQAMFLDTCSDVFPQEDTEVNA